MRFNILKHPVLLLKAAATIVYIAVGATLLIIPDLLPKLGQPYTSALGVLLIIYGILRMVRIVYEIKEKRNHNNQ